MIVSGGHILAIDGVDHDFTLSGDGVKTPIGITEELLEKIRDVSGKLDTTAFETWSAQTEHWDVQEYSGGEGIKVENHLISVSGEYLDSSDLDPYATKQWVEDQKYITSDFLEPYAKTQWVQEELDKKQNLSDMSAYAQSAWVDENFLKAADYHEYTAGNDYIKIEGYKVYGYDWTSAVSAVPFKLDTSSFSDYSAWADETYLKKENLDGYATSAGLEDDKQYAMTSNGWSQVVIPKEYPEVQAGHNINVDKVYSKDDPTLVSAYVLSGHRAAELTSSGGTIEITSSGEQSFNIETKRAEPEFASCYSSSDIAVGTSFIDIPMELGDHSAEFSSLENLEVGLYHVDATFAIRRDDKSLNRGMGRIAFSINGTESLLDLGEFDASSTHVNYANISFDKFNPESLICYLKADTAGWIVNVERYDVHRIFDMNLLGNIVAELSDYSSGAGIYIDDAKHTVNVLPSSGIMINEDNRVAMNVSSGIKFDHDGRAYVPCSSGIGYDTEGNLKALISSGLGLDQDGVYVKVGSGLKFDSDKGVMAITIDNQVEDVVATVEEVKGDMASKLTTNFPYPMITDVTFDFGQHNTGGSCICQLFSVPFRHSIVVDETYITVYTKDVGYKQTPVIFGIFEYDPTGNEGDGTTNFICDTGPVSISKNKTSDILEFPIKHVNSDTNRQSLRPDRLYYSVLAMPSNAGSGIFLASCKNYDSNVNSMPTLNWRMDNTDQFITWDDPQNASLEQTEWWKSGYNEDSTLYRFFMQIRNHITVN